MSSREALRAANAAYFMHAEMGTGVVKGAVLDVGCGAKPYKRLFPKLPWTGLDRRPVGEIEADFHAMPCADDEYDTVVCTDALQYAEDPAQVLREMARVVKPGGHVLLIAPYTDVEDGESLWGFRVEGLTLLIKKAGLDVERAARVDFPNGGIVSGALHDFMEVEKGALSIDTAALGWATEMDKLMPTMVAAVASKPTGAG